MSEAAPVPRTSVDPGALRNLTGHAGDGEFAPVLVERYCALLPVRVHRILAAVDREDLDAAMDAALSLKVSSRMLGARELGDLGGAVEKCLRRGDLAGAALVASRLPSAAERARQELASYLRA